MIPKSTRIALAAALLALPVALEAQPDLQDPNATYLVAGISFEQLIINGYAATDTDDPYLIYSVIGLYTDVNPAGDYSYVVADGSEFQPRVTAYWDGTNGSSQWNVESEFQSAGGIGGWRVETEVGEAIETTRRLPGGDRTGANHIDSQAGVLGNSARYDQASLGMTVFSGNRISFVVDASGYDVHTIKFAGGMVLSGQTASIAWSYAIEGGGTGSLGTTPLTDVFSPFVIDAGSALRGAARFTLIGTLSGTDGERVVVDSFQFIGSTPRGGTAPTVSGTPPSPVQLGAAYTHTFTVTGDPAPALSVSAGSLPPGLVLTGLTVSGTPTQGGLFEFTVRATNGVAPDDTETFQIAVNGPATIANALSGPPPDGLLGAAYEPYAFRVGGHPVPTVGVSAGAIPPGLTLSGDTISGTPTAVGAYTFSLTATNPAGSATLAGVQIAIQGAPVITPPADFIARRGQPFSRTFTVGGYPAPALSLAGTLPAGVSFAAETATISGTPTSTGRYPLTLTASNAVDTANESFILEVRDLPVVTPPSGGSLSFITGTPGQATVVVSGFPAPVVSGVTGAPAWLSVTSSANESTGVTSVTFSGTPTVTSEGSFSVSFTASNDVGSIAASIPVQVTVSAEPPVIVTQPQGRTVVAGASVTLSVVATGRPTPGFQWRRDGDPIPGATAASLTLANIEAGQAGGYDVVVSNAAGTVTSTTATLVVVVPARIVQQPVGVDAGLDEPFSLTVVAEGTAPITYQWRKDGLPLAGATGGTYAVSRATAADAGRYDVIVSNSVGPVTSEAVTVTVEGAPRILSQPTGATVAAGTAVELFVVAESISPAAYQWRKDGADIDGATAARLVFERAGTADTGRYEVVVSNRWGSVTSAAAELTVVMPPAIVRHPASRFVVRGRPATFAVEVNEGSRPVFQWLRDGQEIAGATAATYTLPDAGPEDVEAVFACRVANAAGTVVSTGARVAVYSPAAREVAAPGGTFGIDVWTGSGLPVWSVTADSAWITASRVVENDVARVRYVVPAAEEGVDRESVLSLRLQGFEPGSHRVRQFEKPLVSDDLSEAMEPDGAWSTAGTTPVTVVAEAFGRQSVLGLGATPADGPVAMALPVGGGVISEGVVANDGTLRLEADVYLKVDDTLAGDTSASVGLTTGAFSDPEVQLTLRHAGPSETGSLRGRTWVVPAYRGDDGLIHALSEATSIPVDAARNIWVRLRVEVAADGVVTFWIDPEPFGDPIQVWNPVAPLRASALSQGRMMLGLGGGGATNRPYVHAPSAVTGILARSSTAKLVNLSTLAHVGAGDDVAVAGLKIAGAFDELPTLLIRTVGPGLSSFGVPGVLAQPRMTIRADFEPSLTMRVQGTWEQHRDVASTIPLIRSLEASTGAFPLTAGSADSAWVYQTGDFISGFRPGTIIVSNTDERSTGTALVEIYSSGGRAGAELLNLSTRATVKSGAPMVAGFVLDGDATRVLLVRAVGPGLSAFNIAGPLARPALRLHRAGELVLTNAGWGAGPAPAMVAQAGSTAGAFALAGGSADSALVVRAPPGLYTAEAAGAAAGDEGTTLVEIYALPVSTEIDTVTRPSW